MELVTGQTQLGDIFVLDDTDVTCRLRRKDHEDRLPGQPRVRLDSGNPLQYFRDCHLTQDLDRLIRYIKLASTNRITDSAGA